MDAGKRLKEFKEESSLDEERDIWEGCYSALDMIGLWLGAIAVSILIPLAVFLLPGKPDWAWLIVGVVLGAIWLWLAGVALYRKFRDRYLLTSQRFKHRRGILFRKANRIELIDIDDVIYLQGPVQAMLGVGNIVLKSSDETDPELTMRGIAEVRNVADLIDNARRDERRQRGLHIEAI